MTKAKVLYESYREWNLRKIGKASSFKQFCDWMNEEHYSEIRDGELYYDLDLKPESPGDRLQ
jgi:hypothetical protein